MASFDSGAFSTDAFSEDAFDFTSAPPEVIINGKVIVRVGSRINSTSVSARLSGTRVNAKLNITRVK